MEGAALCGPGTTCRMTDHPCSSSNKANSTYYHQQHLIIKAPFLCVILIMGKCLCEGYISIPPSVQYPYSSVSLNNSTM